MFKVILHRKAISEIRSLPDKDKERILDAIKNMESNPFSGDVKPIRALRGVFRRRIGDYRIAFTINFEASEVIVLKVSKREKFYEGL
ncbi:MAG: type II toxin-antitoxin system RelE/ParE family toxin [archaeon]|nr:type II toxin-antitoxin system RelE/ParE family toxin [archaeon]MCP8313891.1 type II toxin-antitoxin system RelE/ParE family toxin [archaeon]